MKLLSTSREDLEEAAAALRSGLLVAFPTETVYGLGGDAFNPIALAKIFEAKRRPHFDPLIIHIASTDRLESLSDFSLIRKSARKKMDALMQAFWPGPLTLILPKKPEVPDLATSGLPSLAVRFPDHAVAQILISLSGGALAAPSANPFGYLSPTRAEHVIEQLDDRVDFIIDGGPVRLGVESTVLDMTGDRPCILRPGGLPREAIEECIGPVEMKGETGHLPHAPGQLKSHYAPRTPLELHNPGEMMSLRGRPGEAYIFFDERNRDEWFAGQGKNAGGLRYALSRDGNMAEAAANLFSLLHELDRKNLRMIHAEQVPDSGLGLAINDRLRKARARAKE